MGSDKTYCTSDASTCDAACCEADTNKCGGLTITCAAGFFNPSTAFDAKTPKAVSDAWKNLAANETNKNTVCCDALAQCTNYTSAHKAAGITTTPVPVVTTTPA